MHEFQLYRSDLLKWTKKTLKRINKWKKNTYGRAALLEMLHATIIFQRFSCIRKLILQEIFHKYIQKYAFYFVMQWN